MCAYFGRILPTLEDSHSQSTTFQRFGNRPKSRRDCSSLHLHSSDVTTHWETRSGVKGFLEYFLFEKAQNCWNSLNLQAFEKIVALLVYGMVLFPNPDQLIDVNVVIDVIIIDRCGQFPNVTLLGIRGGITYNPCLALRQFGYARRYGPHDMLIPDLVFDFDDDTQGL